MDVWNLEQVRAVHRLGSFAKAAEALGVSQPSLSKSIARLEDELRVKIFERTAAGAVLTPIGQMIAARAETILAQTEELAREAELIAGGDAGTLKIGFAPAWRSFLPPEMVRRLIDRHPRLRLELVVSAREHLVASLNARALDVAFVAYGSDLNPDSLSIRTLLREPIRALASPDHPLAGRRGVTLREFAQHPCIGLYGSQTDVHALGIVEDPFSPAAAYKTNDFELLLPLALSGAATMLAALPAMHRPLLRQELVILDVDLDLELTFVAAAAGASATSLVAGEVIDMAQAVIVEIQDKVRRFAVAA